MKKLIHITDLYHPHNDPDDHFDLAQIYALVKSGEIELCQIIIDYPTESAEGDPALCAAAQLNELVGKLIPAAVGTDVQKYRGKPELWKDAPAADVKAPDRIIEILRSSDEPVYITIVGGCLDTAIALVRAPEVFREKCAGIVLNAGSSVNTAQKEWNVALGCREYAEIFRAPCPVFWNPCFDDLTDYAADRGVYKTFWKFRMREVFDRIGDPLRAYFLYMLTRTSDPAYLRYLRKPVDPVLLAEWGEKERNMWCTGSIFDIAGLTVSLDGSVLKKEACSDPLFSYESISVTCDETGVTTWKTVSNGENEKSRAKRYIFKIHDEKRYPSVMTEGLARTLGVL